MKRRTENTMKIVCHCKLLQVASGRRRQVLQFSDSNVDGNNERQSKTCRNPSNQHSLADVGILMEILICLVREVFNSFLPLKVSSLLCCQGHLFWRVMSFQLCHYLQCIVLYIQCLQHVSLKLPHKQYSRVP